MRGRTIFPILLLGAAPALADLPTALTLNQTLDRQLSPADKHEYQFTLEANQYARIELFQYNINVGVECIGPDGKQRFELDAHPIDDYEIVELIADTPGAYTLRVTAADKQPPPGRYNITLKEIVPATERHKSRIAAARAFAQASKILEQASREEIVKAIVYFESATAHWHAAQDLFEEARTLAVTAPYYAQNGDKLKALDATTRSIAVAQASRDRRIEAWAYITHGMLLTYFGDRKKGIEYSDRALPMMRAVGDHAGEAAALNILGKSYSETGDGRQAIAYLKEALRIFGELQERGQMAVAATNLGTTYDDLGEFRQGLEFHQESLRLVRELKSLGGEATALNNLAGCYSSLAEYQKALDAYTAALEINRKLDRPLTVAINLHNIAWIYDNLGDRQRGIKFYQEAMEILRPAGDQRALAFTLNNIATIYSETGDFANALKLHNEALSIRRNGGDIVGEAISLSNLGRMYYKQGDKETARDHYERSVALFRKSGEQALLPEALRNLGQYYRESGDYERALTYLDESLEIARSTQNRRSEATSLAVMARVERDRANWKAAHERAQEAIGAFETLRLGLASPTLRASFFVSARQAQEVDIEALVRLHDEAAALLTAEKGRARSLLEMLGENSAQIRSGMDSALLAREHDLQQLIAAKAEKQVRMLSRKHTDADAKTAGAELTGLTTELDQVQTKIRQSSPQYAALVRPAPLALNEIQTQVLDADTVLLEYAVGSLKSFLFVVTPSSIDSFELPPRAEIESAAKQVYDFFTSHNRAPAAESAAAAKAGSMLLAPAASKIRNKRLLIVAEGVLQYLPFASLPDPVDPAVPLVVNHELVSAPSSSVIALLRRETASRRPAPKSIAILADPVFDAQDARVASPGTRSPNPQPLTPNPQYLRLRFSRAEADAIARLAPLDSTLKAVDFEATREAALSPDLAHYRIVHFATHSILDNEHPELSGVVLSLVDRAGRQQNGFLRLYDIYNLRLGSDLVVLSACRTALGGEIKGEGLIGLTRGFLYAGAPRVVATLWEVDDRTTSELMKRFYEGVLARGERPAAALRAAQTAMWKTKGWDAPYYWAAFTLQGEWR